MIKQTTVAQLTDTATTKLMPAKSNRKHPPLSHMHAVIHTNAYLS